MRRRTYLTSLLGSAAVLSGCSARGLRTDGGKDLESYQPDKEIVYDHDDLSLEVLQDTIHHKDEVEFRVSNTSQSQVTLGCDNPWALQKNTDGKWQHVTWTNQKYYDLCASLLPPGDSITETVTLSESKLETQASEVKAELTPGNYRFVVLGSSPFLAVDFEVQSEDQ